MCIISRRAALTIIAGSAALHISDIPWSGPISGTMIGFVDGEFVVNPTNTQMQSSTLELVAAGTNDNILMVEAGAREFPEDLMLEALKLAHESNQATIALIEQMRAAADSLRPSRCREAELALVAKAPKTLDRNRTERYGLRHCSMTPCAETKRLRDPQASALHRAREARAQGA